VSSATPNLTNVFAHARQEGRPAVLRARAAQLDETDENRVQRLTFFNGTSHQIGENGHPDRVTRFERLIYFAQRPPSDIRSKRRALSTAELASSERRKEAAEFQWRVCMPFISLLVSLMGIELGRLKPRQSPYPRFALGLALYALVFNLSSLTKSSVENGLIPIFPGVYTAVAMLALAFLVMRRSRTLSLKVPA
jgi:lipopolysaccharide export LptBFGC system permease protein LptF